MSFRVLVIPEDPTYNGYILQPIVERMLAELGKSTCSRRRCSPAPNSMVTPTLSARSEAISSIGIRRFDLWLFLPDGDRASNLEPLESELARRNVHLFCCAAQPEVEAWLLAGYRDELAISWGEVRQHPRLKEEVFEPFLRQFGDTRSPGSGRENLTRQTLTNYRGLLHVCPELAELEDRLRTFLAQNP